MSSPLGVGKLLNVLLPIALALSAAPVAAFIGTARPRWVAPVSAALATASFAATLWGWVAGGGSVELPWVPALGLRLHLALDGLAALYALLATGIGALVVLYSSGYMPRHLEHEGRRLEEQVDFYAFLLMFMGAMVGLAMSLDLILLFVFWDLTMVSSYYLIGYDHHTADSRYAALMALLVTGITSVLLLVGALLLYGQYQTFSIPEISASAKPGPPLAGAVALMVVAGLAKSAQIPFHFWLPRAMVAPTPVSAYLHSAAMVAAGVFLLERISPLLGPSGYLGEGLLWIGLLSLALGSLLALAANRLKQLLAYSTIAQYGYVVAMLGVGGSVGVAGASFYVLAHAIVKSALFLAAGAVTEATGDDRFSHLGGLWRSMPLLAVGSGIVAAGLAGLPLTIGFFKDEFFFQTMLERPWPIAALAVVGTALTLAYSWRFWSGIFLGPVLGEPRPVPATLVGPVVFLAIATVAGGVAAGPLARLGDAAGGAALGVPADLQAATYLDLGIERLLTLAAYGLGALLVVSRARWVRATVALAEIGARVGPDNWYNRVLAGLGVASDRLHQGEVRDLRRRITSILIPTALLVGAGIAATPTAGTYLVGSIDAGQLPLTLALSMTAVAAFLAMQARNHLTLMLVLSAVGYGLSMVYAFLGAPDVALVAVLVETSLTLLLLSMLALFPGDELQRLEGAGVGPWPRWRDLLVAGIAGGFALMVTWATLSQPAAESVAAEQIRLTPQAHGGDVVTAILADFRGLDTLGEITVIAIGLLGVVALLRGGELW